MRARPAGVTGLFFAVCADHGFRVDGSQASVESAVDRHLDLWHCAQATCGTSLSNEEVGAGRTLCAHCRAQAVDDDEAERAADLEREAVLFR